MTVSENENVVYNWNGDDSSTTFDFDFLIEDETQLVVMYTDKKGQQSLLIKDVDYTIEEVGNINGSFINYPIKGSEHTTLQRNEIISLILDLPIIQDTPYEESEKLVKSRLERNFDYLTRLIAIQNRKIERSVKVQEGADQTADELIEALNNAQVESAKNALLSTNSALQAAQSAEKATLESAKIQASQEQIEKNKQQIEKINTTLSTKYAVNSGAVDTDGNPAYLVSYTQDVEIPATAEGGTATTETHTYLKLLAGTVYTDGASTHTVQNDVILDITDLNVTNTNYNVFIENVNGSDVLTVKTNAIEVCNVATIPAEGADDNYLIIPQEPLKAYWVNSAGTKTSTNAVNIGSYAGGGVTKPQIKNKDYNVDIITDRHTDGEWVVFSPQKQLLQITLNKSTNSHRELDLTDLLPKDSYDYECTLQGNVKTGNISGNYIGLTIFNINPIGVINPPNYPLCATITRASAHFCAWGTANVPIFKNRKIWVRENGFVGEINLVLVAYRRLGKKKGK